MGGFLESPSIKGAVRRCGFFLFLFFSVLFYIMASGVVMARGGHGQRVACGSGKGLLIVLSYVMFGVWFLVSVILLGLPSVLSVTFLLGGFGMTRDGLRAWRGRNCLGMRVRIVAGSLVVHKSN